MSSGSHAVLVVDDTGTGRPVLVLHGGGGPDTMKPIVAHLAAGYRVLTPTLPGWNGAPRPESMTAIGDYARAYVDHLTQVGARDVVVIGSSLGGWIAAEMAAGDRAGVLGGDPRRSGDQGRGRADRRLLLADPARGRRTFVA